MWGVNNGRQIWGGADAEAAVQTVSVGVEAVPRAKVWGAVQDETVQVFRRQNCRCVQVFRRQNCRCAQVFRRQNYRCAEVCCRRRDS